VLTVIEHSRRERDDLHLHRPHPVLQGSRSFFPLNLTTFPDERLHQTSD
jgi:hypothetical protein